MRAAAQRYDYSASDLDHWDQVIEEAVTNVIQLAFDPGEEASFDIDCLQGAAGLTVKIRNRGRPFDARRIQPIGFGGDAGTAHQLGLGWHMIQQLMDVVTLEYPRAGRPAAHPVQGSAGPLELGSAPAVTAAQPIHEVDGDISCRKATADDAAEVTRLFYDCYHYSYFNEQIYRPEALAEMMARGDIDCMVAELPDGRLIGHSALIHYPDRPRAIETGMAVIDPAHRGQGIMAKLQLLTNDAFARSGKIVRFGGSVTAHAVSQKASIHNGNNEVGLMLGAVPAEDFSSLAAKAQGRGTIVYMAALLGSGHRRSSSCHLSTRHSSRASTGSAAFPSVQVPPGRPARSIATSRYRSGPRSAWCARRCLASEPTSPNGQRP